MTPTPRYERYSSRCGNCDGKVEYQLSDETPPKLKDTYVECTQCTRGTDLAVTGDASGIWTVKATNVRDRG
jgi:hypothetical protein